MLVPKNSAIIVHAIVNLLHERYNKGRQIAMNAVCLPIVMLPVGVSLSATSGACVGARRRTIAPCFRAAAGCRFCGRAGFGKSVPSRAGRLCLGRR